MLAQLWKQRLPLMAFALSFQLLEDFLFTPAVGLVGGVLMGRPVGDGTAVVECFLSVRGFLVLFLAATVCLTIRLIEHAGLSAMVLGALERKRFRALATFQWLVGELPRLAPLGARNVGLGVLVVMPLLLVVAAVFAREIDVQLSKDGVLVVTHRVACAATRRLADLNSCCAEFTPG